VVELFEVALTEEARHKIDAKSENRWVTEAEVRKGLAHDGRPVSPTMKRLLEAMTSGPKE
jgi:hypothetical protein